MPFVIRRRIPQGLGAPRVQYISKRGVWEDDWSGRVRLFPTMGAVKLSIGRWPRVEEGAEIVEMVLQETGTVLLATKVMGPVSERREHLRKKREIEQQIRAKERDLAELKRLKEKYRG